MHRHFLFRLLQASGYSGLLTLTDFSILSQGKLVHHLLNMIMMMFQADDPIILSVNDSFTFFVSPTASPGFQAIYAIYWVTILEALIIDKCSPAWNRGFFELSQNWRIKSHFHDLICKSKLRLNHWILVYFSLMAPKHEVER